MGVNYCSWSGVGLAENAAPERETEHVYRELGVERDQTSGSM